MRRIFLTFFAFFLVISACLASPLTLNEVSEAVCRINSNDSIMSTVGSGTCIGSDETIVYVLTNAHVVNISSNVKVEFFRFGYKSQQMSGKVILKQRQLQTDIDVAVIAIEKQSFANAQFPLPRVIPLAPKGCSVTSGFYISSAGCPEGRPLMSWEGNIQSATNTRLFFKPAPVGGQSGSPLFILVQNKDGEWNTHVGGMITWRIGEKIGVNAIGGAIPVSRIYDILENKAKPESIPTSYHHMAETSVICKNCGLDKEQHFVGSDNKLYCAKYDNSGQLILKSSLPDGVSIRQTPTGCPNGSCPSRLFGNNRTPILPRPQQNQREQQDKPILPPSLPNFGAPWANETPTPPTAVSPPAATDSLSGQMKSLAARCEKLEKDKATADAKIKDLEASLEAASKGAIETATETVKKNPWLSTVFVGLGGGLLYFLWMKIGRKIAIKKIESLQDLMQQKVSDKWGAEAGSEVRGILEGVESALLNVADTFLEQKRLVNRLSSNSEQAAVDAKREQAMAILEAFQSAISKEQNKFLATQVLDKKDLEDILNASMATEVAEKDEAGIATLKEVQAQLAALSEKVTLTEAQKIVTKVQEVEAKDNDKEVLEKLAAMQKQIESLSKV